MLAKRPPPLKSRPPKRKSMPPSRPTAPAKNTPPPLPTTQKTTKSAFKKFQTAPPGRPNSQKRPPMKKKSVPPSCPPPRPNVQNTNKSSSAPDKQYYSIEQIKQRSVPGLDYANAEKYVSQQTFSSIFK
eukprot:TRINITY_DN3529_c0_g1_i2.p1 TRINITY_DN3529_c0_g1~~TRINITY_DN3529_c0_g1_i2.p1  ORF type:complete len:129 (+),score=7.45 TRINITY_DN3529_c0_g1_i2:375-761(+)